MHCSKSGSAKTVQMKPEDRGGKDLSNIFFKSEDEQMIDGEREDNDCDELIWVGEPWGQWTEWGWRNEEGSWFHRWGDAYLKERLVICNEEDTGGRSRLTFYRWGAGSACIDWTESEIV